MRKVGWMAAVAALAASPAAAQNQVMCGPAVMAANAGADVDKMARSVEGENAPGKRPADPRQQAYAENLRIRRAQAEQYAVAARNGVPMPANAAQTLRAELAADIDQWRAEFRVSHGEAQAMREQWLVERDSLTAVQWAQRRVDWWHARDAWVAAKRQ